MDENKRQASTTVSFASGYIGLAIGGLVLLLNALAAGEANKFKQMPQFIGPDKVRTLERSVKGIVNNGSPPTDEERKTLGRFYVYHILSGMTRADAWDDPQRFPNWRRRVIMDLASLGDNPQGHRYVRDLIYKYALKIAADSGYAPVSRYNAVLLIGSLNQRETQGSGRQISPAVPDAKARSVLVQVCNSKRQPQTLKIGALIGLARHAKLMAAAKANVDPKMVKTFENILSTPPDKEESEAGLWWMQRIVVDALGDLGRPGAVPILQTVVVDASRPIYLRCAAADALGRLDYRAAKIEHAPIAKGLGQLALVSLTQQIQSLQQFLKENPPEERGGFGGAQNEEPEENPYVLQVRRQLTQEMSCVLNGVKGLQKAAGNTAAKDVLTSLSSELSAIVKELDTKDADPQGLLNMISPPALRLESAVNRISARTAATVR